MDAPYKSSVSTPDLSRGGTVYKAGYRTRWNLNRPSSMIISGFRAVWYEPNHTKRLKSGAVCLAINGAFSSAPRFSPYLFGLFAPFRGY
jgi:hypothetical protein